MRKFFLFCLFVVCFLFAGFAKQNLNPMLFDLNNNSLHYCNQTLVYGQTICTQKNNFNLNEFLNNSNTNIVQKDVLCDRSIIYAYCNKLDKYVYVAGKRVNLQVSVDNDYVYIGYPLITGSF